MKSDIKKVEFYIFRHGETDWNLTNRFQGHTDIPLNAKGLEQAEILRPALQKLRPQILVSSDLQRAVTTAKLAMGNLQIPFSTTAELRECNLGNAEGKYRDEIIKLYSEDLLKRWSSVKPADLDFGLPDGETKLAHQQRLIKFLISFQKQNPDANRIAVSTHGGSLRRIVHHCENAPAEPIPIPNCVLYQVNYFPESGKWLLDKMTF